MMKNLLMFLLILIIKFQLNYVNSQLVIGSTCVIPITRITGTCKLITQCPSVIQLLKTQRPTVCGYQGSTQIVCCPNLSTPPTTATPLSESVLNSKRHLKCIEYAKTVYEVVQGIPLLNGTIYEHKIDTCGFIAIPLIVGGTLALPKEFPHSALLGYQMADDEPVVWDCGGALVSENFVLTAGHCLNSRDNGNVKFVKLGDLNTASNMDDARPETIRIAEIIPHPAYTTLLQYNDIALLRLERQATISPYIRPICLPLVNITTNIKAVATGWGSMIWGGTGSTSLLKVILDLFTDTECHEKYQLNLNRKLPDGILSDTQLCAGSRDSNRDTCQGDSGGPIQEYNPNVYCMYTILGVTSFGKACGTANNPGVYTRVSSYVDWIERVVWPN